MVARTTIGQMRERVCFLKRASTAGDGAGNYGGEWTPVLDQNERPYECAARIMPKLGGEEVTAARLQGVQPMVITVRGSSVVKSITPQHALEDVRRGIRYNIKSISNPDERGILYEMVAVSGKAL